MKPSKLLNYRKLRHLKLAELSNDYSGQSVWSVLRFYLPLVFALGAAILTSFLLFENLVLFNALLQTTIGFTLSALILWEIIYSGRVLLLNYLEISNELSRLNSELGLRQNND